MPSVFTIESKDGQRFAMYGTTDGGRAVLLFPTRDDAEAYILVRGLPTDLHAVELTPANITEWLKNAQVQGATYCVKNPQPDASLADLPVVPLTWIIQALGASPDHG